MILRPLRLRTRRARPVCAPMSGSPVCRPRWWPKTAFLCCAPVHTRLRSRGGLYGGFHLRGIGRAEARQGRWLITTGRGGTQIIRCMPQLAGSGYLEAFRSSGCEGSSRHVCALPDGDARSGVVGWRRRAWSNRFGRERIPGEWSRAAAKLGPQAQVPADAEIAMVSAHWPKAKADTDAFLDGSTAGPDASDIHVLAAAIAGHADVILTVNAKDFPRNILAEEGVSRSDPDAFLLGLHASAPEAVSDAVSKVHAEANRLSRSTTGSCASC